MHDVFSFRARADRLSFVILIFPYIDLASHVFVVSVLLCIFKIPIPARDPLVSGVWTYLARGPFAIPFPRPTVSVVCCDRSILKSLKPDDI